MAVRSLAGRRALHLTLTIGALLAAVARAPARAALPIPGGH
jgi:hypothetical protein